MVAAIFSGGALVIVWQPLTVCVSIQVPYATLNLGV